MRNGGGCDEASVRDKGANDAEISPELNFVLNRIPGCG
jgi:hypothetical protein